jgi:potassium-dependent mechanosensitive channel
MIRRFASPVAAFVVLALALLAPEGASAGDPPPFDLDATRSAVAAIDTQLKDPNLTQADLQRLRADTDSLGVALQAEIARMTPILAASTGRLAELTPKTKEAPPATDAAAAELASEKQKHDALDANLRAARAMLFQTDDDAARIGARRRELFNRETFARSTSLLDPELWVSAWREAPSDLRDITALIGGWLAVAGSQITLTQVLGAIGGVVLVAMIVAPVLWLVRRAVYRGAGAAPSRLRRALAAVWTILALGVLPLLVLLSLRLGIDVADLPNPRMKGVLDAVFEALNLIVVFNAIGRGLLAPRSGAWRLVPVDDGSAARLFGGGMAIAAIWAAGRLVEASVDAVGSLSLAVATRAIGGALIALTAAWMLRRPAQTTAAARTAALDAGAPTRTLGWILVAFVLAADAVGYVAFANFLVNQALFLAILASVLYLIDVIVRDGGSRLLEPDSALGARLLAWGLRRNALAQIVVVFEGLFRLIILVVVAAAVLEPWGVQSQDWLSSLRAAYFGFAVGGVTLSLSSLLAAGAVFAIVVFLTRLVQQWLSRRLLPHTRLDAGVRNSIGTIFGYVGTIAAVLLAGAQIGLDFQKLAIIAGGLSVGIGFGLQSVALNFVSGLILLWERAIRVGDWVVVGAEQGFVRRINARATEIETFDCGTLIVPNSNLVTGVVKNWVRADRTGRILISVNVAYESDVEQVRDMLIAAAKAQEPVLAIPAPAVQLAEFADWSLKFHLVCFIDDVEAAERVRSEMSFDILRRMREAQIRIPYPK